MVEILRQGEFSRRQLLECRVEKRVTEKPKMMKSVTETNGARLLKDIENEKCTLEEVSFGP